MKQGAYFCRSVRIPLLKNYNSPPCMVKSSFSLIQGAFLLPLLLPRMLGAAAHGKDPAQATHAQHQVLVVVSACVQGHLFTFRGLTRARAGPNSLPPDLGELVSRSNTYMLLSIMQSGAFFAVKRTLNVGSFQTKLEKCYGF